MAQLYFKYGAMNSGKSIEILKVAHNYEEQGKPVLLMTSSADTRAGQGVIESRIGVSRAAVPVTPLMDVADYVGGLDYRPHCILVDEAQFMTRHNVLSLVTVVDDLCIPVMCFGLKNDFRNDLFTGSEALLEYADKIEEIKTICQWCGHKATMNLRVGDGRPVRSGEQVQIGGNESYISVCRRHWFHPVVDADGRIAVNECREN
ncbi:thymidine kinase [Bifidobacterium cuniculi]|uniref:Thymidine kinase n=1 Tax=Bifidobacterium cuniculi TaxID=1688 RepID=A0A087AYA8_9BIFI|nr:thymidine kinase [Bifidobacterium cuniculi]KFI63758.1 thymidine kinase [Bifidobacterium cuniculi]